MRAQGHHHPFNVALRRDGHQLVHFHDTEGESRPQQDQREARISQPQGRVVVAVEPCPNRQAVQSQLPAAGDGQALTRFEFRLHRGGCTVQDTNLERAWPLAVGGHHRPEAGMKVPWSMDIGTVGLGLLLLHEGGCPD